MYNGFYFILLNVMYPKGNNWTFPEFAFLLGTTVISVGSIFVSFKISNQFFHRISLGYRYAIMLLMSIPVFCILYLPYWVSFIRSFIYGLATDKEAYAGQLYFLTTGLHLPVAIITITSLYNAHSHKVQTQLLNVQNALFETQLKNLQRQVDPHFLFNSLNILSALIKMDAEKASLFTQKLSEVYRFFLKTQKETIISLKEELELVNDYFFLITCRFGSAFRLEIKTGKDTFCESLYIIPGTLQMLVENVIKHNIADETSPTTIEISIEDNKVMVANRVSKKNNSASGYGLSNLTTRYQMVNGEKIDYFEQDGFFRVQVPVIKKLEQ